MVEVREALYGFLGGTKACIASSFCVPKCSTFDSAPSSGSSGASAAPSHTSTWFSITVSTTCGIVKETLLSSFQL